MTRPDNRRTLRRRHFVAALAGAVAVPLTPATALAQASSRATPSQTLGPFYPRNASERPAATDSDLLVVEADRVLTKGTPIFLRGQLVDRDMHPVAGAQVEIWQCDAMAVYHHPAGGAEAERDPNFQGYGIDRTDDSGVFRFRTILPVAYPGRTPHIHVRLQPQGSRALATQLYLPNDPGNARDFLFSRLSAKEQKAVLLVLEPTRDSSEPLARATRMTARTQLVLA
jgi:protocatechuate 3,4-dioxygenase beta subunit